MSNALQIVRDVIFAPATKDQFAKVLCDTAINFDREAGFAMQALQANSYLCKIATENRASLFNAVVNAAAIGISLNPAEKQSYIVPRDGKVCLDISYMGLMYLAMTSGSIKWGQAFIVREGDQFTLNGADQKPTHVFDPFGKDRGEIKGVYVVVKTADGDYLTHTMAIDAVYKIRDRSAAWKKEKKGPWLTDEEEMIKKTCVKQASKYWPKNKRLDDAIHYLNTDGDEGIDAKDMGSVQRETVDIDKAMIRISEQQAVEDLSSLWQSLLTECNTKKDRMAYDAIKDAVMKRKAELENAV